MTILQILNIIIDRRIRLNAVLTKTGTVKSVSETNRTCVVTIDDIDYEDILLQGSIGLTTGMVLIPTVDSQVIVNFKNQTSGYISCFSSVSKILIDTTLVQFNGGDNDGMVLVGSTVDRLNKIEDDINSLKKVFSDWVVVTYDGGGALKTAAATWYASTLTKTVQSDIENTKITQ